MAKATKSRVWLLAVQIPKGIDGPKFKEVRLLHNNRFYLAEIVRAIREPALIGGNALIAIHEMLAQLP